MEKETVYRKEVKMRFAGDGAIEVTIPKIIVERAARKKGLTLEGFVKTHKVVHLFNNFSDFDAAYRFIPVQETEEIIVPPIS